MYLLTGFWSVSVSSQDPPRPHRLVPRPHHLIPRPHRLVPRPHCLVPRPHHLVPRPHRLVPRPHCLIPRPIVSCSNPIILYQDPIISQDQVNLYTARVCLSILITCAASKLAPCELRRDRAGLINGSCDLRREKEIESSESLRLVLRQFLENLLVFGR